VHCHTDADAAAEAALLVSSTQIGVAAHSWHGLFARTVRTTLPYSSRGNMFEFLKNFFVSKPAEANGNGLVYPTANGSHLPTAHEAAMVSRDSGGPNAASAADGPTVPISLQSVLNNLQPELKMRVTAKGVPADATVAVPLNIVLAQPP
jgi:hypothetical protein